MEEVKVHLLKSKAAFAALAATASVGAAVATSASATVKPAKSGGTPTISVKAFNNTFSGMSVLKPLVAEGKGKIAAILPDTTSSTRYVEFDEPDLKNAMKAAGLPGSDIIVQNGQGSDSTFLSDAKADITNGASVLLIDPEDSGVGLTVENYAKAHGVQVIDYDRLVVGGSAPADPYVSFNNVRVGQLIGQGFVSCVKAWHVRSPKVIVMRGDPTDNNALLFFQGYDSVLSPLFAKKTYTDVANPAGTWTPTTAANEFETAFTANPGVNSAVIPNDENAAPIITYLQSHGVKPDTFPITGQDATLTGLDNILAGYQCGTVYKPVYLEAQAAVALAMYLRAGKAAPAGLLNGTVTDPINHKVVKSVLDTPEWVTTANMESTVIKDKFVPVAQLCSGNFASDCTKYGIK
jgi:D-xylose transport system substrate-binding protein